MLAGILESADPNTGCSFGDDIDAAHSMQSFTGCESPSEDGERADIATARPRYFLHEAFLNEIKRNIGDKLSAEHLIIDKESKA